MRLWLLLSLGFFPAPAKAEDPPARAAAESGTVESGIKKLLDQLPVLEKAEQEKLRLCNRSYASGTPLEDPALFQKLRERNAKAEELLVRPDLSKAEGALSIPAADIRLMTVFSGAYVLAMDASFRGDRATFDRHVASLLRWQSCLMRSDPTLLEYAIIRMPWRHTFNALLQDWERHPDQAARLAEIREIFARHRITRQEVASTGKGEVRAFEECGGLRGYLEALEKTAPNFPMLKAPFDQVRKEELLKLPYDHAEEMARNRRETEDQERRILSGKATDSWPEMKPAQAPGTQLEDYRNRKNGLGDLVADYSPSLLTRQTYAGALALDPMLELGLKWLEQEGKGQAFGAELAATSLSPEDGKSFPIDITKREIYISSHVEEEKPAAPNEAKPVGFWMAPRMTLRLPRWRQVAGR